VNHFLAEVLNIAQTDFIAEWDAEICCVGFGMMICPGFSSKPEL
jgi:hypothetical protein